MKSNILPRRRRLSVEPLEGRRLLAIAIDVGHHRLLEDTPGQYIDLFVSSQPEDPPVSDFLLRAQIKAGLENEPTPIFRCSDVGCVAPPVDNKATPWFVGAGQIWDASTTTVLGGPLMEDPPAIPAGFANLAQATVSFNNAGVTTPAAGFLVRLEVDTTDVPAGQSFELMLAETDIGDDSHFLTTGPVLVEAAITNGVIEIVSSAAPTVQAIEVNSTREDPPNRPSGPQPTNWITQRSDLADVRVTFDMPVRVTPADLVLTNLGVDAPNDPDATVPLDASQLSMVGNVLTINFPPDTPRDLTEGVYRLDILPTVSNAAGEGLDGNGDGISGDAFTLQGDASNRFYQIAGDLNGDLGVTIFDFPTFAYWFGVSVPAAPFYVDLNLDDGVSIFDFPVFAANFGESVTLPDAVAASEAQLMASVRQPAASAEQGLDTARDAALRQLLYDWTLKRHLGQASRPGSPS